MESWSQRVSTWWAGVVSVYLLLPIIITVIMSFSPGNFLVFPPPRLSLHWYREVVADSQWKAAGVNSLVVGGIASALATLAGVGLAIGHWLLPSRWRAIVMAMVLGPAIIPVIVLAVALFFALAGVGLLGTHLGLGMGHALLGMPVVFLIVLTALDFFDIHLLEAAESLGASRFYAWRTVLVPFLLPAIVVGALLAFVTSFDEAVIAIFIGRGSTVTIPNLMWRQLNLELSPAVAAVSTFVMAIGLILQGTALIWFQSQLARRRRSVTMGTALSAPLRVTLGNEE